MSRQCFSGIGDKDAFHLPFYRQFVINYYWIEIRYYEIGMKDKEIDEYLNINLWSASKVYSWLKGLAISENLLNKFLQLQLNGRELLVFDESTDLFQHSKPNEDFNENEITTLKHSIDCLIMLKENVLNKHLQSYVVSLQLQCKFTCYQVLHAKCQITKSNEVIDAINSMTKQLIDTVWYLSRPPFIFYDDFIEYRSMLLRSLSAMALTWERLHTNENDFKAILQKQLEKIITRSAQIAHKNNESLIITVGEFTVIQVNDIEELKGYELVVTTRLTFLVSQHRTDREGQLSNTSGIWFGDEIIAINNQVVVVLQ
ncbi:hypothetical protein GJ496_005425 [Pomphorhynchus laevis]|nr:hypothetical protein GJ496_005425 [Pomphorhynchus laevis]